RNLLQEKLLRGTVECLIVIKSNGSTKPVEINTDLIKSYYLQISQLADELSIDTNAVLAALLRLPEVVSPSNELLDARALSELMGVIEKAVDLLNQHRAEEGKSLDKELRLRIENINAQE